MRDSRAMLSLINLGILRIWWSRKVSMTFRLFLTSSVLMQEEGNANAMENETIATIGFPIGHWGISAGLLSKLQALSLSTLESHEARSQYFSRLKSYSPYTPYARNTRVGHVIVSWYNKPMLRVWSLWKGKKAAHQQRQRWFGDDNFHFFEMKCSIIPPAWWNNEGKCVASLESAGTVQ